MTKRDIFIDNYRMFDGPEGAVVLHIECTWPPEFDSLTQIFTLFPEGAPYESST